MQDNAVLLLAYGGPDALDDIPDYLANVLGQARQPTAVMIENTTRRYELIGGSSPLRAITEHTAHRLQERIDGPVYVGMRHWHPYIKDTVADMVDDGIHRVTAICMAPHYSTMSVAKYRERLDEALRELNAAIEVAFIEHWHTQQHYIDGLAANIRDALSMFPKGEPVKIVFTAHSLPASILERGDPYVQQLQETTGLLAEQLALPKARWTFAYQSAASGRVPWLDPDLIDGTLPELAGQGEKNVLVAPVGFIAEHLEILYDLDIAARQTAKELGLRLERTPMLNDSAALIEALAELVASQQATTLTMPH